MEREREIELLEAILREIDALLVDMTRRRETMAALHRRAVAYLHTEEYRASARSEEAEKTP